MAADALTFWLEDTTGETVAAEQINVHITAAGDTFGPLADLTADMVADLDHDPDAVAAMFDRVTATRHGAPTVTDDEFQAALREETERADYVLGRLADDWPTG